MRSLAVLLLIGCLALPSCASPSQTDGGAKPKVVDAMAARRLPMFDGSDGSKLQWSDLLRRVGEAEIIVLGEQHDDAAGHAVQLAIVEDAFLPGSAEGAGSPGASPGALSMEMLERDEQAMVDDYLDGFIDAATFAKLTESENWAGDGTWAVWYQPIIDAAKRGGAKVVAANAPRRYVRLARTDDYDKLDALPMERRELFDLPAGEIGGKYRERFFDLMKEGMEGHGPAPETSEQETEERIAKGFRSQLMWDATMGASVAHAKSIGAKKVIHLIGQFHCDFEGGTVQQIRHLLPDARVLVISMQRGKTDQLRDEDRDRAGIVVYTGEAEE